MKTNRNSLLTPTRPSLKSGCARLFAERDFLVRRLSPGRARSKIRRSLDCRLEPRQPSPFVSAQSQAARRIDRRLRSDREHLSIFGAGTVTQRHDQTAARAYHARKVGQGKLSGLI